MHGQRLKGKIPCIANRLVVAGRPAITSAKFWPPTIELRSSSIIRGDRVLSDMRERRTQWAVQIVGSTEEAKLRLYVIAQHLAHSQSVIVSRLSTGGRLFVFGISESGALLAVYEPMKSGRQISVWNGTIILYGFSQREMLIQIQGFQAETDPRVCTSEWSSLITVKRAQLIDRAAMETAHDISQQQPYVRLKPIDNIGASTSAWSAASNWMFENKLAFNVRCHDLSTIIITARLVPQYGLSLCAVHVPSKLNPVRANS